MSGETGSALCGLVLWVLMFRFVWWNHRRVSRNRARSSTPAPGTGPKWEQDTPFAECFNDDEGDDL